MEFSEVNNYLKYGALTLLGVGLFIGARRLDLFDKTPEELIAANVDVDDESYYLTAEILHEAMSECWRTWPLDVILAQQAQYVDLSSDEGFLKLFKAFGVRPYDKCVRGLPDWMYIPRNLWAWMWAVSDEAERTRVNDLFAELGITYRL